jgi:tryptophan synthase alpha chain
VSRIAKKFDLLKREGRKAFIPYIMSGDPDIRKTTSLLSVLSDCGADIIELGVPFSDPLADGPTIQRAAERAISGGTTLAKVIEMVSSVRKRIEVPIVLMTYYNPVFKYGEKRFIHDAVNAGVDGVIIPDLPPDEAGDFIRAARPNGLDTIFLLAPTSTEERIRLVTKNSTGFTYYVSMTGITGSVLKIDRSIKQMIRRIRSVSDMPVCVGFGISTPEEAKIVSSIADGVIIGSAIVRTMHESPSRLEKFLTDLRKAI